MAVAAEWEKMPYLVTQGQGGALITYTAKNAVFNRRDVINNADILGPLIQELGSLASNLKMWVYVKACQIHTMLRLNGVSQLSHSPGMRPSVYQICDVVEDFFWRVRPRGKPPIDGTLPKSYLHGFPKRS